MLLNRLGLVLVGALIGGTAYGQAIAPPIRIQAMPGASLHSLVRAKISEKGDKTTLILMLESYRTEKGEGMKTTIRQEERTRTVNVDGKGPNAPSYTKVFGQTLSKLAETDGKIVGITAAMPSGTGMDIFAAAHPKRMFDVGIAEQHGVTFAAGLAAGGLKPFCAIYSTFLQRGYDQIVHDVALQNLPVRFAIDRAGLVGADGATHAGAFDIGYLCALPNMTVMAASDEGSSRMSLIEAACCCNSNK